jgi:hypothetical protein
MIDSWLIRNTDHIFFQNIQKSLSKDLSFEERQKACQDCQIFINNTDKSVYNIWHQQILPLAKNYETDWLVKLINE